MKKSTDWYRTWFDSPYYHLLYGHRDEVEASVLITNLTKKLGLSTKDKVLDLACGRGRHARILHSMGAKVVGVDLSEQNIAFARQFGGPGLEFHVHDMREPYALRSFDAVFNLFTSFGYFEDPEDDRRVIRAIHQALCDGGHFILDYLNPLNDAVNSFRDETIMIEGVDFNIKRSVENGTYIKSILVIDDGKKMEFEERVKAFDVWHLTTLLESEGFEITGVYGNYDLDLFESSTSERTILIGRK